MKKVMIGILILIPVLILLIVAAVTNILSLAAWIAVDNITLIDKTDGNVAESIEVLFSAEQRILNFYDFVKVEVEPKRANRYSVEWRISGDVECMDENYDSSVQPAAMLVDNRGFEVESNTTGKFAVSAYCRFNLTVQAEQVSKTLSVTVEGYDVEKIKIIETEEGAGNTMKLGESKRVDAQYTPMSSRVTRTNWHSADENVAVVDENGVITAVGLGKTDITVEANKDSNAEEFVTSEVYHVEVVAGISKYGASLSVSKRRVEFDEIGVQSSDVLGVSGGTVSNNGIQITSDSAVLTTQNGDINISICSEDDIAIAHTDKYDAAYGFVMAHSALTLSLHAIWADDFKDGYPDGVVWTSSDTSKATVSDGVVTALSIGQVRITASKGAKSASVLLNIQNKVVSMQLRTSNYSLSVGLARETVFAAEKYTDISVDNTKEPNRVPIEIVGAPVRGEFDENESEQEYRNRLAVFYDAYSFAIESGEEYAEFGGEFGNTLIFKPSELDGKVRQVLTIKVSAKYPRYKTTFTQGTVDINVVNGVEVTGIKELRQSARDQKEYAYKDGNLIEETIAWEHVNDSDGRKDRYRVYNEKSSHSTYSIVFAKDIAFETDDEGNPLPIEEDIVVYGNIYGNNKKAYADLQQFGKWSALFYIAWSNVTVSNLNVRANSVDGSGTITTDETSGFTGQCFYLRSREDADRLRLNNVRIEYCIMENCRRAAEIISADLTLEGNVIRNVSNVAMFAPSEMNIRKDSDSNYSTYPRYSHLTLINNVYSECLSSIGYFPYECYTYMPKTSENPDASFNDYNDSDVANGVGRFVRGDLQANDRYFKENFIPNGINSTITQRGFLDIYNWQDISNTNLIGDLGDDTLNQVVSAASGSLLKVNETFTPALYNDKEENKYYFHMGFLTSGIHFPQGIFSAPTYLEVKLEDKRFTSPIRTLGMPKRCTDFSGSLAETVLVKCDCQYYSYTTSANITPYSTYEVNNALISRLHGE